jgi:hypothetical protein
MGNGGQKKKLCSIYVTSKSMQKCSTNREMPILRYMKDKITKPGGVYIMGNL